VLASKAGDAEANKRLSALAADPADAVRVSVVSSLAVEASTSSVAIIGGVLADHKGNIRVRRAAAAALAGIKNDAADAELLKHLSDADAQIKASAMSRRGAKAKQQK
jgi:HEAT repeat protein